MSQTMARAVGYSENGYSEKKWTDPKLYQRFAIVFLAYIITARAGQYLFYSFHTSPALLWPPVGLALAFLVLWGYEQWIPIALAQLLSGAMSPAAPSLAVIIVSVCAYTAEFLIGAYLLKKAKFDGSMSRTRDALLLVGTAAVVTAIAPTVIDVAGVLMHTLTGGFWASWSRSWAGGILSALVFMPFVTTWLLGWRDTVVPRNWIESAFGLCVITATTYVLFWTTLPTLNAFLFIYLFLAVLFWIGLRMQPRVMTLALLIATIFGMLGSILAHPTASALNVQLFADELFIILIAPIFLVMVVVVAERRTAARELKEETEKLELALQRLSHEDESKNEFIAVLAHELRNPLAPIASALEYLQLDETDGERLKVVVAAEQQMRIVRRLLDDLLDVARITQKKFELRKEVVPLESVLRQAMGAIEAFYRSRQHHLSLSLPAEPAWLDVDPARMTQAITNLLFNAGKYTPPGGAIALTAQREGDTAVVSVTDNGTGIPPEAMPLLFQPFQQAPREARVGTGLGLGLFITKQLVEMHEGTITAESAGEGKGSRFAIRLPLPHYAQVAGAAAHKNKVIAGGDKRTFRVLVVDDNVAAATALQKLLTLRGHHVETAANGKEALEAIRLLKPQVVLLDIGLPDINGYDLARQIRAQDTPLFLAALTGYGREQDRVEAREAGFDHHFTKPVGLADIEQVFATL